MIPASTTLRPPAWAAMCAFAVMLLACGGDDRSLDPTCGVTSVTTSSATSGGGGAPGMGGAGAEGGGESVGGMGGGGEGGSLPAADAPCSGDYAFQANGLMFKPPTPAGLALALQSLTFPAEEHPITVVLRAMDAASATMAASPTKEDGNFSNVFFPGLEPMFTAASIKQGSFESSSPQGVGYLQVRHDMGLLDLQLTNLAIVASTSGDCGQAVVTIDAVVPAAERSKTLTIDANETTVGTLAEGGANDDIQLGMLFQASTIAFDFGSL